MTTATLIELPIEDRITNAVAVFRQQDKAIAVMKTVCLALKIAGVDDREGYTKVYESRQTAKRLRVAVGKKAKSMKEDALRDGKMLAAAISEEDERITAELKAIEDYLQTQEDEYEAAKETIRAEKAAAAQAALQRRIDRLTEARCPMPELAFLRDIDADNFELYFTKAVEVQAENERLAKIEADRLAAIKAEEDRLEAEYKAECERKANEQRAELARQAEANRIERERIEAERKAMEAEREAALHRQAIQQKQIEEQQAEVRRQQQEILKSETLKQMAENKRLAELARAEAEAAEAARLEALQPEIEKALKLHDAVNLCVRSYLDRIGNPSWSDAALREINAACNQIKMIVENS